MRQRSDYDEAVRGTLLLLAVFLGACRTHPRGGTSEAVDDPALPEGVVSFRETIRNAETIRVWLSDPVAAGGCLGNAQNRLHNSVLSIRADGVIVLDPQGGGRRRWSATLPPIGEPRRYEPGWMAAEARSEIVVALVGGVLSRDTRWVDGGLGAAAWSGFNIYLRLWDPPPGTWRLYVHFNADGAPSSLIVETALADAHSLAWLEEGDGDGRLGHVEALFLRMEVDPPLPTDWFDADKAPAGLYSPAFSDGIPMTPVDTRFYAPGASVPPSLAGHAYIPVGEGP